MQNANNKHWTSIPNICKPSLRLQTVSDIFNTCFILFITFPFAFLTLNCNYFVLISNYGAHILVMGPIKRDVLGLISVAPPICQRKVFGSKYLQTHVFYGNGMKLSLESYDFMRGIACGVGFW